MRRRTTVALASAAVIVVVAAVGITNIAGKDPDVTRTVAMVPVGPSPDGKPVQLDTTLFVPDNLEGPAPAVILAHGFGGSKDDETKDAVKLAQHGYVALTYSARGFGKSGGQITLDSPDYEVKDASRLIDLLAKNPHVQLDKAGDPRVGIAGGSYGGALTLEAAGYDQRVDAIVPAITWNELGQSLFPQFAQATPPTSAANTNPIATPGVFKKQWAAAFFGHGIQRHQRLPHHLRQLRGRVLRGLPAVRGDRPAHPRDPQADGRQLPCPDPRPDQSADHDHPGSGRLAVPAE